MLADVIRHDRRRRNGFYKLLMLVTLVGVIAGYCIGTALAEPKGHLVSEVYVVQAGDTLWTVAEKFIVKSSVRRDIREFISGIEETNWDLLKDRQRGIIYEGDRLIVSYWVSE